MSIFRMILSHDGFNAVFGQRFLFYFMFFFGGGGGGSVVQLGESVCKFHAVFVMVLMGTNGGIQ